MRCRYRAAPLKGMISHSCFRPGRFRPGRETDSGHCWCCWPAVQSPTGCWSANPALNPGSSFRRHRHGWTSWWPRPPRVPCPSRPRAPSSRCGRSSWSPGWADRWSRSPRISRQAVFSPPARPWSRSRTSITAWRSRVASHSWRRPGSGWRKSRAAPCRLAASGGTSAANRPMPCSCASRNWRRRRPPSAPPGRSSRRPNWTCGAPISSPRSTGASARRSWMWGST